MASSNNNNNNKNKLLKTLLVAAGCSCSCSRPKPVDVDVEEPSPKWKSRNSVKDNYTCSSSDHKINNYLSSSCSIAVVKDSSDPYEDFRHSMLQMIFEKEIYSKDDLQQLLNCFLELNSSSHHPLIIQAFTGICNEVISSNLPT